MLSPKQTFAAVEPLDRAVFTLAGVRVSVLRLDTFYPELSGNKYFKLKLNLQAIKAKGIKQVISFGGAFSNHLHALAHAAHHAGLSFVAVIRGERLAQLNPTLLDIERLGATLHFVSRGQYRLRHDEQYHQALIEQFGEACIIPEGGSNALAVKGCAEIVSHIRASLGDDFDTVILPCGTGATLAGIASSLSARQTVLGVVVLKGAEYIEADIAKLLQSEDAKNSRRWRLLHDFHGGGYAKCDTELAQFITAFKRETLIATEPVYSGKMFMALERLARDGQIERGAHVVAIHTGGMQGLRGMQSRIDGLLFKAS